MLIHTPCTDDSQAPSGFLGAQGGADAEYQRVSADGEDRRTFYVKQIAAWCACRRVEEGPTGQPQLTEAAAAATLSAAEIGQLERLCRLRAQRASLVDNFGHLFAANKSADLSAGILLLITYLSDNEHGCCRLSMARMAKYFRRSERAVRDAVGRLEGDGLIRIARTSGRHSSRSWPVINRLFAADKFSIVWLLDARAPSKWATTNPEAGFLVEDPNPEVGRTPTRKRASYYLTNINFRRRDAEFSFADGKLQLNGDLHVKWQQRLGSPEALQSALIVVAGYLLPEPTRAEVEKSLELHRLAASRHVRPPSAPATTRPARDYPSRGSAVKAQGGVRDTSESVADFTARMIREGHYKPALMNAGEVA